MWQAQNEAICCRSEMGHGGPRYGSSLASHEIFRRGRSGTVVKPTIGTTSGHVHRERGEFQASGEWQLIEEITQGRAGCNQAYCQVSAATAEISIHPEPLKPAQCVTAFPVGIVIWFG